MPIFDSLEEVAGFSDQVSDARRFFLGPRTKAGATVLGGGFERVQADYLVERAGLRFVGLEFVVGGRGVVRLNGGEFALTAGTFFIYDEQTPHRIATDPKRPLAKYFVDLDGRAGRRLLRAANLPVGRAWQTSQPADVARLLGELVRHGTSALPNRRPICDQLFAATVLHAAQSVVQSEGGGSDAFATYQRCCHAIDEDACRLRSLEDVARQCRLDAAYVCRLFRRFDRQTPYQRLLRNRMGLAAARLYGSDVLVKDVATELGYRDAFHFSRSFKSVYGVSPEAFRSVYRRA